MTAETIEFLIQVLNTVNVSAGAPDFEATTARIIQAKRELVQALQPPTTQVSLHESS